MAGIRGHRPQFWIQAAAETYHLNRQNRPDMLTSCRMLCGSMWSITDDIEIPAKVISCYVTFCTGHISQHVQSCHRWPIELLVLVECQYLAEIVWESCEYSDYYRICDWLLQIWHVCMGNEVQTVNEANLLIQFPMHLVLNNISTPFLFLLMLNVQLCLCWITSTVRYYDWKSSGNYWTPILLIPDGSVKASPSLCEYFMERNFHLCVCRWVCTVTYWKISATSFMMPLNAA